MKKPKNSQSQLEIFQTKSEARTTQENSNSNPEPRGKIVHLDSRSRIYEKILNRKME
jgi:hypothetical protein